MPSKKEISFITKEESKQLQESNFLALSPSERFFFFIRNMAESQKLFKAEEKNSDNFILSK